MFKIGDFSKLCLVSVRMLRHYDELGLLKPVSVDKYTGYRYYSAHQLSRPNRILALKDLGLSLDQIAQVFKDGLTSDQIKGMLKLKRLELRQQIKDGQLRLERIETWLEREELFMSSYNVVIKKVEPILVAEVRGVAPDMPQIGPTLDGMFDKVAKYMVQNGYPGSTPVSADDYLPGMYIMIKNSTTKISSWEPVYPCPRSFHRETRWKLKSYRAITLSLPSSTTAALAA